MSTLQAVVNFDYDRSDIDARAAQVLSAKVPLMREDPSIRIRVEGHADERGSIEYNLALGMRRAQAVKNYLSGFQLDGGRFQTESLGEERPAMQGQSESAYAANRRAEFVVLSGTLLNIIR
jgi:peptidoglycan-associated lipoprotein